MVAVRGNPVVLGGDYRLQRQRRGVRQCALASLGGLSSRPSLPGKISWAARIRSTAPSVHSLVIATVSTLIALFFGSLAGYGLARFQLKFLWMKNNDIAFWIVSQRIMPPVVVVLAFFILFKNLQLLDTLRGMIIVYTGFSLPLTTWFMESYFKQVPVDLEEAAYIDGAGRLTVFLRVALPLVTPGLIATFLLAFSFAWNEFLFAVMLTSVNATTLPIVIAVQQGQLGTSWWNICAISIISIIPMTFVAIFLQRRLVTGLLGGALK